MKVIIDKRGGGLFFSLAALKTWAQNKGINLFVYYRSKNEANHRGYSEKNTYYHEDHIDSSGSGITINDIESGYGREILTKFFGEKFTLDTSEDCDWFFNARFDRTDNISRTDSTMIDIVETLGIEASEKRLSHLVIVSVPDHVNYWMNGESIIYSKTPIYTTNAFQSGKLLSEEIKHE